MSSIRLYEDEFIFHAGTDSKDSKTYATGGRVLNFVSLSGNFKTARDNILKKINELNWPHGFYRRDIGYKVIDKWEL